VKFNPSELRKTVVNMAYNGQSVHVGCAFSLIEILSSLYGKVLKYNPKNPVDPDRDYLVLSKGHGVMAQYACFHELGWIGDEAVEKYFADGSMLHGLSESHIPGCEVTSGSLGHGLPIGVGIAKGLQLQKKSQKVYTIVGDGELNEGSIWEALLFAAHHKLKNFYVIVDANEFQAMGKISDVLNMESLTEKFSAFGFETAECDGHDLGEVTKTLQLFSSNKPKALIARTVKGKGVSFMERDNIWHYTRLDQATLALALTELDSHKVSGAL
jgi:transketolase